MQATRGRKPGVVEGNCQQQSLLCGGKRAAFNLLLLLLPLLLLALKAAGLPAAPKLDIVI
jgi:hypothetical protein